MVSGTKIRTEAILNRHAPAAKMRPLRDRSHAAPLSSWASSASSDKVQTRLTVHDAFADDGALIAAWDRLAASAVEPNPFAESWVVLPGLAAFGDGKKVSIFALWQDDEELAGLIVLADAAQYGRFAIKHITNWSHANSFLGTPLIRLGWEEIFWHKLLEALDAEPRGQALLYLTGMAEDGPVYRSLQSVTEKRARPCDIVFRESRALVETKLPAQEYWDAIVRGKKRKELRRQAARLGELGTLCFERLGNEDAPAIIDDWIDDFLTLERAGWKGEAGSALGSSDGTADYFRAAIKAGHQRGQLDALAYRLDGKPIAMLFHLISGKGGFSFKTAYDERYARFSPGVLIQRENLDLLARQGLDWIDSCAAPDHPMINHLWAERRTIIRVAIPIGGVKGRMVFGAVRLVERLRAWTKGAHV